MGPLQSYRTASVASVALAVASLLCTPPALGRVWTNTEGETLEAEFVRLRGRDALLKTEERTITAPVNRLVQEDRDWIERYRELMRSREWGKPGAEPVRGQFIGAKNGKVRLKHGSKAHMLPYDQLSEDDWRHADQALAHMGQEMPEDLLAFKPIAPAPSAAIDLDEAIERTWTDAKGREIVAKYLGVSGPKVRLWMRDKEFVVPLARFSDADRGWVARQNLSALTGSFQQAMSAAGQVAMRAQMSAGGPPPGMPSPASGGPPMPPPRTTPSSFGEGNDGVPPGAPPRPGSRQPAPTPTAPAPSPEQPPIEAIAVAPTTDTPPTPLADAVVATPVEPPAETIADNGRGAPPWVDSIDDLSFNEQDKRYREAFGDWVDNDDMGAGEAACSHCDAYFVYPESFGSGKPCPYCGVALSEDDLASWDEIDAEYGGTPWYLRRWARRIIITLVLAGIGTAVKLGMGGE